MDYRRIAEEVGIHNQALEEIDEKNLMYQFHVRRLRAAEANKDRDPRTYQTCLEDMQGPLCLAYLMEILEKKGCTVLPVSTEERMKNMILKGKTNDGEDYHLSLEQELDYGEFIVTVIDGEEAGRYPVSNYREELFTERKGFFEGLSGLIRRSH